jgi:predicted transposase YbfD/YdcC
MQSSPIAAVLDDLRDLQEHLPTPDAHAFEITDGERCRLVETLGAVPDPRRRRGVRYRFTPLLAAAVCAMLCGAKSFAAIIEWIADLPGPARASLGLGETTPAGTTLWRLLVAVDPVALQAAVGAWLRARVHPDFGLNPESGSGLARGRRRRRVLALDGKTMRATLHGDDPVHLLGVLDHATSVVVAQVNVDAKTNEIPCFRTVLDQIEDLRGVVVTADAMHAQTGHVEYLQGRGAHLLVCVKANQPTLLARLKALPWKDIPTGHTSSGRGHGRIEKRTLKVVTVTEQAGGLGFPGAAQAIQVTRKTRRLNPKPGKKNRWRTETVYAIITLPAEQATAAELATWIRGHWLIEDRLHWVRDVTLGEDLHQARTGNGPQVLAILRNLILSLLRLTGHDNIARALRQHARHPDQAIAMLTRTFTTTQ